MKEKILKIFLFYFVFVFFNFFFIANAVDPNKDEIDDEYIWERFPGVATNRTDKVKDVYGRAGLIANYLYFDTVIPILVAYSAFENKDGLACMTIELAGGKNNVLRKCLVDSIVVRASKFNKNVSRKYFDNDYHFKPFKKLYELRKIPPSDPLVVMHKIALNKKKEEKKSHIELGHLIIAFFHDASAKKCLTASGVSYDKIKAALKKQEKMHMIDTPRKESSLDKYGRDLSKEAKEGRLTATIGREEEIRSVIEGLSCRVKANPLLIGEPGVGKTAIVEGLALMISSQTGIPKDLLCKSIIELDLTSLLAGATYRGEFEQRFKDIIRDTLDAKNVVLFIDEIHIILGAGKTEGAMDTANMLKPLLARGELRLIGATTIKESDIIEKDSALARRFQKIFVQEASTGTAISILRGLKNTYESFHHIRITDNAIIASVELSKRYIKDRFLPDKAIEILDKACAKVRVQLESKPEIIDKLEQEVLRLTAEADTLKLETNRRSVAMRKKIELELANKSEELRRLNLQYEADKRKRDKLADVKKKIEEIEKAMEKAKARKDIQSYTQKVNDVLPKLIKEKKEMENELEKSEGKSFVADIVDVNQIADIVSRYTGIPVNKITEEEKTKLLTLADDLKKHVVGQDDAIKAISRAILNNRTGLKNPDQPIGSFLFLGPTGVGKTELAKAVAIELFDNEKLYKRFDMSEYNTDAAISRLIGSPPGYVGHEEGGQLTDALRKSPYSVVLFDEIEKAHIKVSNILLQVFDDGRLTDSQGRTVDCSNSIFILTSNLGAEHLKYELFDESKYPNLEKKAIRKQYERAKNDAKKKVEETVRNHFSPEFLNRLDSIEVFNPLTKKTLKGVIKIQVKKFSKILSAKDITIQFDDPSLEIIIDASFRPDQGARPIGRYILKEIGSEIAELMVREVVKLHSHINVTVYHRSNVTSGWDSKSAENNYNKEMFEKHFKNLINKKKENLNDDEKVTRSEQNAFEKKKKHTPPTNNVIMQNKNFGRRLNSVGMSDDNDNDNDNDDNTIGGVNRKKNNQSEENERAKTMQNEDEEEKEDLEDDNDEDEKEYDDEDEKEDDDEENSDSEENSDETSAENDDNKTPRSNELCIKTAYIGKLLFTICDKSESEECLAGSYRQHIFVVCKTY